MNRSVFALALASMVPLLFGAGSCASHSATTVSPERAAEAREPAPPNDQGTRPLVCDPGTADCDRDTANGCEVTLADDPDNCGVCGVQCDRPQATSGCIGGTCRTIQCNPGYQDLDHDPKNGCEAALERERP